MSSLARQHRVRRRSLWARGWDVPSVLATESRGNARIVRGGDIAVRSSEPRTTAQPDADRVTPTTVGAPERAAVPYREFLRA